MNEAIPATGPLMTLVYPSIGHAEFGRLLAKYGYDAEAVEEDGRIGYRTLCVPRFTAWMQTPFEPRPGEFGAIFLFERFQLTESLAAAVVQAARPRMIFAHIDMRRNGGFAATHTLVVSGGITEYYLRNQLWHWKRDLERIRLEIGVQARRVLGTTVH